MHVYMICSFILYLVFGIASNANKCLAEGWCDVEGPAHRGERTLSLATQNASVCTSQITLQ